MKKSLVLILALAAIIGMIFAVNASAAEAAKLEGLGDVAQIYASDGTAVEGNGWNGGSLTKHAFDGSYDGLYQNTAGRYVIIDLNAKLAGGYYISDIKIYHAGNTKYSLYYTNDGTTWKPLAENVQVAEANFMVNDTVLQIKYVFDTTIEWTPSLQEIEVYNTDPSLEIPHIHDYSIEASKKNPDCVNAGYVTNKCVHCDLTETKEIAPNPDAHSYGGLWSDSNDEVYNGMLYRYCENGCGTYATEENPMIYIFTFKGYSFNSDNSMAVGFAIDYEALASYEELTGKTLEIGVVFAGYDNLGGKQPLDQNGNTIELEKGKVVKANLTAFTYTTYEFVLTDISEDLSDISFVIAGYIFNGETVKYVQANGMSDTVYGITYNEAKQA